jgi:Ni/Fe-hydrogenase subunit HybB-like protein
MDRVKFFKSVLWIIVGLGMAPFIVRFLFGLGAIANMNDAVPWGLWKGFNIFPGIALAGGGFVMTAVIYIMAKEEYHKYAKISVLLAFLGYITAATALVTELGLPWMVWHPIIYWQHHSALFEVSWCVVLYLTVLFLEFLPVPLDETSRFAGIRKFLTKYKIVLVFLGIMISTLHQSSLGTMWLITPEKLHPLWYTSLLPILFFLSAVAVGPLMLILAILTVKFIYRKEADKNVLSKLGYLFSFFIMTYGLVRIIDIGVQGKFPIIFDGSWQSALFIIEISLMIVIPLILLWISRIRNSFGGLWVISISAVIGLVLDRATIAGIVLNSGVPIYRPTIFEILISLMIICAAILAFLFCIESFKIWGVKWEDQRDKSESGVEFNYTDRVWLGTPRMAAPTVYSLIFVISLAIGFTILPIKRIYSGGIEEVPARKARGENVLFIDGNRDGYGVVFKHTKHSDSLGIQESCSKCHHMNMPLDKNSGCWECHEYMYSKSSVFNHDWHSSGTGVNISCEQCHPQDRQRSASTAKQCNECHSDLVAPGSNINFKQNMTVSYTDAMHNLCVDCHKQKAIELADKPNLAECATCHKLTPPEHLHELLKWYDEKPSYNRVVLPVEKMETD